MARSRNIKPAFFQNDKLAELTPIQRLLFIGLWTIADYKGCLEYRPKKIKAQLLPYDELDIKPELIGLNPEFIRFYTVDGQQYIKISNFTKHQHPHKNEVQAGSDIPDITEQNIDKIEELEKPELIGLNPEKSGSTPPLTLNPLTDSLNPRTELAKTPKPKTAKVKLDEVNISHFEDFIAENNLCPQKVSEVIPEFIDYWKGVGQKKDDWLATFRNRIRNKKFGGIEQYKQEIRRKVL